jgi:hypothetical protein
MKNRKRSRGQAIVEFTLMLPLLIMVIGGLTDVGLAYFVSLGLQNGVRAGARLAAVGATKAQITAAIKDEIPKVGQFILNEPIPDPVRIDIPVTGCPGQRAWTVSADGTYNYMFLRYIGFTTITIGRSATFRDETKGICT